MQPPYARLITSDSVSAKGYRQINGSIDVLVNAGNKNGNSDQLLVSSIVDPGRIIDSLYLIDKNSLKLQQFMSGAGSGKNSIEKQEKGVVFLKNLWEAKTTYFSYLLLAGLTSFQFYINLTSDIELLTLVMTTTVSIGRDVFFTGSLLPYAMERYLTNPN